MEIHTKIELDFRRRRGKDGRNIVNLIARYLRDQGMEGVSGRLQGANICVFNVPPSVVSPWLEQNRRRLDSWGITKYHINKIEVEEPQPKITYEELERLLQVSRDQLGTLENELQGYRKGTDEDRVLAELMRDEKFAGLKDDLDAVQKSYQDLQVQARQQEDALSTISQTHADELQRVNKTYAQERQHETERAEELEQRISRLERRLSAAGREVAAAETKREGAVRSATLALRGQYDSQLKDADQRVQELRRKLQDQETQLAHALRTAASEDEVSLQGKYEKLEARHNALLDKLPELGIRVHTTTEGEKHVYEKDLRSAAHALREAKKIARPPTPMPMSLAQLEKGEEKPVESKPDIRLEDYGRIMELCRKAGLSVDEDLMHNRVPRVNIRRLERALDEARKYETAAAELTAEHAAFGSLQIKEAETRRNNQNILRLNEANAKTYVTEMNTMGERVRALQKELEEIRNTGELLEQRIEAGEAVFGGKAEDLKGTYETVAARIIDLEERATESVLLESLSAEELLAETLKKVGKEAFADLARRYDELYPGGLSAEQEISLMPELEYLVEETGRESLHTLGISLPDLSSPKQLMEEVQRRTLPYEKVVDPELGEEFLLAEAFVLRHALAAPESAVAQILPRQKEIQERYGQAEREWNGLNRMAQVAYRLLEQSRTNYVTHQQQHPVSFTGPAVVCYAYTLEVESTEKIAFLLPVEKAELQQGAAQRTLIGLGEALQGRGRDVGIVFLRDVLRADLMYDKGKMPKAERLAEALRDIEETANTQTSFGRLGMRLRVEYLGGLIQHGK